MYSILIAILVFGFLILVHEFGHYITARIFKVGINEFSIGMGPKIFQKKSSKTNIAYSLRALPIGGYVSMVGEDEESESEDAFNNKPCWQRLIILAAGAFMNILVGIIITAIITLKSPAYYSNTISVFAENAPSQIAGLQVGDTVIKIGDTRVHTWYDTSYTVMHDATEKVDITVVRDGKKLVIEDVEFKTTVENGVKIALRDFNFEVESKSFKNTVKQSVYRAKTTVVMIWDSIIDLIKGKYGFEAMSGPVGITGQIGSAASAKDGGMSLLNISALLALNLGIINLMPFPALDGGRIVFVFIEMIRRKPIKREIEGYINFAGLALLMLLILFVTFQDITRLF